MSGTVLRALELLSHLVLTTAPGGRHYGYLHSTIEETEVSSDHKARVSGFELRSFRLY